MGTDIGVKAGSDREAVERIAERRGMAADAMLRRERARARALFGRGALYRADIMGGPGGTPPVGLFTQGRVIARTGDGGMCEVARRKIRCAFNLTEAEAAVICDARCEPKPSTAAAQIVRKCIKEGKEGGDAK